MKPLNEEKTVLHYLRVPAKFFLPFVFMISTSAQTGIGNFCYYKKLDTAPGYQKIFLTDYSKDRIPDLVLLNGAPKQVIEYKGDAEKIFSDEVKKFFFYSVSDMNKFFHKPGSGDLFLFLSRSESLGGLVSFTNYGTIQLLNKIEFETNPDKSIIADINNNGTPDAVVFGSNFDGLTHVYEENYALKKEPLLEGKSFSEAAFINLDYDEAIDIVAFDYLNGTLDFLYNEDEGVFFENRTMELGYDIRNLKVTDFNGDGYDDLMFNTDDGINFFKGDSVSSFEDKKIFKTETAVLDYVTGDFNNDRLNDLAYINKNGQLFISFAVKNDSLAVPVLYMQKEDLTDIQYMSRGKKKFLIALSDKGQIYIISNTHEKEDYSVSIGVNPGSVDYFDYSDTYNKDLCFVDGYDNKLKILLRGNSGGFEKYFEYQLEDDFKNIAISGNQKPITTFYCYSQNKKLLERLKCDFSNGSCKREKHYFFENITDIYLAENDKKETVSLLLNNKTNVIRRNVIIENKSVVDSRIDTIKGAVESPVFSFHAPDNIHYWINTDSSLLLGMKYFGTGDTFQKWAEFKTDSMHSNKVISTSLSNDKIGRNVSAGFVSVNGNKFVYLHDGIKFRKFSFSPQSFPLITGENAFAYYKSYSPDNEYLFCYDETNKTLYSKDLHNSNKLLSGLFKNIYIKNYFVTDFYINQVNLVYTDPMEKCITIRRIE